MTPQNLATLARHVATLGGGVYQKTNDSYPANQIYAYLDDAYLEINRRLKLLKTTELQALVANQAEYDIPSDILDRMIAEDGVSVKDAEGLWSWPAYRDWNLLRRKYNNGTVPTGTTLGTPGEWGFSDEDQTKIILLWPPASARADGLRIDYVKRPEQLSRVFDQATITATVAAGDATVTLSAGMGLLTIVAGDYFGLRTGASTELPTRWFKILSITDTTHFELTENWPGFSTSAALFTTAQVPEIEAARPGLCGLLPAEYAAGLISFIDENPGNGPGLMARRMQLAEAMISQILRTSTVRPGLKRRAPDARRFANFRS